MSSGIICRSLINKRYFASTFSCLSRNKRGFKDDTSDQDHTKVRDSKDSGTEITGLEHLPNRVRKRLAAKGINVAKLQTTETPLESEQEVFRSNERLELEKTLQESQVEQLQQAEFPSDKVPSKGKLKYFDPVPSVSPENTAILLFPGQGSQFVGMGNNILKYPGVEELYHKASSVLGYDLLKICLNGPKEKLQQTLYCQPAVFVTSVAAVERLKEEHAQAYENVVAAAGYSVGEFAALVASGTMTFDDAIETIKLRAIAMDAASQKSNGGMLSVFIDTKSQFRTAMVAAKDYCRDKLHMEDPVCNIAAYLSCGVRVVAGHQETLAFLQKYGKEFGIKRTKMLPVSGAFHTELMNTNGREQKAFYKFLGEVNYSRPKYPVYLNFEGKQLDHNPELPWQRNLANLLFRQLKRPIKWEQTIHSIYKRPKDTIFPKTFEVGPGNQLGIMLKIVNEKAYQSYRNIEV